MAIDYRQCPKCGSKNSVKFVYGMPSYELFEEAQAGKVKLGGCVITEDNPDYCCKDCEQITKYPAQYYNLIGSLLAYDSVRIYMSAQVYSSN